MPGPSAAVLARRFLRSDVGYILTLFVCSRLVLVMIGMFSRDLFARHIRHVALTSQPWLDMWAQWDSFWYLRIAQQGYPSALPVGQSSWGFFPLLPWLTRLLEFLTGDIYLSGLLITNVAFLVGCVLLYRLVRGHYGEDRARWTLAILFAYPTAFVFSGYLSEPLFFALAVACFFFAHQQKWLVVGLLGGCLALTRSAGVFMALPLLWIYLQQRGFSPRKLDARVLTLALVPAGLAVFLIFSYVKVGDPFAYVHAQQSGWGPRFPPASFLESLHRVFLSGWNSRIGSVFLLGTAVLLAVSWRRIPSSYGIYTAYSLVLPIAGSLLSGLNLVPSFTRYSIAVFPIFLMLALLTERSRASRWTFIAGGAALQVYLAFYWAAGAKLVV